MKKDKSIKDSFADREASNYQNPIPSREFLLDYLAHSVGPLTHEAICTELNLSDPEHIEAMRRRLRAMERDGQIASNRRGGYGTLEKLNLIKGRVIGHSEGFGFVKPLSGEGEDIFLSSAQMRRVFDGDIVLVRVAGWDRRGRPEGSLVDIVERATQQLVGRYFRESGINFVRPDNPRISQDILITADRPCQANSGQIVVVDILQPPTRNSLPVGFVSEVLGEHLDPGIEIEMAVRNYGIPFKWNADIEKETAEIPSEISYTDSRVDIRSLPLITIDGEDARDFDDAVYCRPKARGGWELTVAIADVSHYVTVGSELDKEAFSRGNSVYFPNHVVPMLPEKLSNGLCSLNPAEDRFCMVCEMQISEQGEITGYQFFEGIMHSHARMTYTQVAQIIANKDDTAAVREQFSAILPQIDALHSLCQRLQKCRSQRGAIDFDTQETRILFDSQRKISQIIPLDRTDAHRLIEECMLCANLCAAEFLQKSKVPALYRVHEGPSEERLISLRDFLSELGVGLGGGDEPLPMHYRQVLNAVRHRDDAHVIQSVLLRSMSQAVYQCENLGHFGLAFDAYTHFTSPIRRYSDLLVHRAIRSMIKSGKKSPHIRRGLQQSKVDKGVFYPYELSSLEEVGQHLCVTERRADEATRDVVNWLKCEFLLDRVSEQYSGVVSAVTGFGLFVMLDELMVEGLIHVTGLPKDYYHYEASQHRMVGEQTGRTFRLGQRVKVKVVRVNLEERKIDFELIDKGAKQSQTTKTKSVGRTPDDRSKKTKTRKSGTKKSKVKKVGGKKALSKRAKTKGKAASSGAKRKRKSRA